MTVRKGEPWGQPAVCPDDVRVVSTDRDVGEWIIWHRTRDQPIRDLGVSGGDLARTCGGTGHQRPCAARVTVDAMRVSLDGGEPTWGAAHVVARREWLRGDLRPLLHDTVGASDSFAAKHFHRPTIDRLIAQHESEQADHSQRLYALLMLELWWRESSQPGR